MTHTQLQVAKSDLSRAEFRSLPNVALADGQVRLAVNRFALTANNITYAAFGDAMRYWDFFPSGEEGWGVIPVWGFADVVQSLHPGVAVGERLYGYYPMAQTAVLAPHKLASAGFADAAPHRADLHGVYNQYLRCASDPFHTAASEDIQALLRPLFITSWLIDDFLEDNRYFGAADGGRTAVMLLSSASSKTAYGTAFMLAQRQGIEVVGLTSQANVAFCESLGCYHRVLAYEQLDQLPADTPLIYVDFAGNAPLRMAVHSRFAHLAYSCAIGGTHVAQLGNAKHLPGPKASTTTGTRCARRWPSNAVSPSPCSGATVTPCMCARPRVPSRGIKRWAPSSSSTPTPGEPIACWSERAAHAASATSWKCKNVVPYAPEYCPKSLIQLARSA